MKYNYRVEILDIGGYKSFVFRVPDNSSILEIFLNSDISGEFRSREILNACIRCLDGKTYCKTFGGNICAITIESDYTKITDKYAQQDDDSTCLIETSELVLLLEAFIKEKKRFDEQNS